MEKYDIKFKKKLGQNFLNNTNIVKKILAVISEKKESLVVEVGPGGGILTAELASNFSNVLCYEIDKSLENELNSRISKYDNVKVRYEDFLRCDIKMDIKEYTYKYLYFISNVPYYITSPIIMKLVKSNIMFDKIVLMVQKEVGERYSASAGTKNYGSISVILQYFYEIKKEFVVSKNNFIPVPKVDSVVISLSPRKIKNKAKDINKFIDLVHSSFQFKRKTIRNNLKNYDLDLIEMILNKYGFDLNSRAEALPLDIFVDISNNI